MIYDVIIIGAGPSGILAGYTLIKNGLKCLILEQGDLHTTRKKDIPSDVSYGFGGAGLFSDGKLSYYPSANYLWENSNKELLNEAYCSLKEFLKNVNIDIKEWGSVFQNKEKSLHNDSYVKEYDVKYLSNDERCSMLDYCYSVLDNNESIKLNCKVDDVRSTENGFKIITSTKEVFQTAKVIAAVGKRSTSVLLRNINPKRFVQVCEMGIRLECDKKFIQTNFGNTNPLNHFDFKYIENYDKDVNVRTFCSCWEGSVLKSKYDLKHYTYNGEYVDGGKSNIGIIVKSKNTCSEIYSEMTRLYKACSSKCIGLDDYRNGTKMFGNHVDGILRSFIDKIVKNGASGFVYGPEIERYGGYPLLNSDYTVIPGIYVVGDSTALFRGLMAAFLSGIYVALEICKEIDFKIRMEGLAIKTSVTGNMECVFTAHSKTNFYARNVICQHVFEKGYIPINPYRSFGYFLDDRVDRDIIRNANNQMVFRCEELWVYGPISDGVLFEIAYALKCKKPVKFFSVGTSIEDIAEISVDDLKFEPEVHAKRIKRKDIIAFIKQGMNEIKSQF